MGNWVLAVLGCLGQTDGALRCLVVLTCLDGQEVVQLMQQLQQGRLLLGLTELKGRGQSRVCLWPPPHCHIHLDSKEHL